MLLVGCQPKLDQTSFRWQLPYGYPEPVVPDDNSMTGAKVALGRVLFYDTALSFNQTQSCATCHQQALGFTDARPVPVGSSGMPLRRNSQGLLNVAYNSNFTWAHSGLKHIEQQILIPLFSEQPIELGATGHESEILSRLETEAYREMAIEAFGQEKLSFDMVVKALASFVRSLVSFQSDFDRYAYYQQDDALSDSAKRGLDLFFSERLECHHCHGGINFTQSSTHEGQGVSLRPFHNTGLYNVDGQGGYPETDQGLIEVTRDPKDMGRFRAPSLRNVAVTAPYMHDGSVATLEEVLELYANGGSEQGRTNPYKNGFIHGFVITPEEKQDLLAFLHSLTDEFFLKDPRHGPPE